MKVLDCYFGGVFVVVAKIHFFLKMLNFSILCKKIFLKKVSIHETNNV